MTRFITVPLIAIPVFAATFGLYAQQINVGNINGSVTDPSGAIVPGTAVVAVSAETNVAYPSVTTSAGLYNISLLPVGKYTVTATKTGFEKGERTGVEVIAGTTFTVNFVLRVGSVNQTVTVSGRPPIINATDTHQGTTRTHEELQDLPISLEGTAALTADDVVQTLPGVNFYDQGAAGQGWMVISRAQINGVQGFIGYEIDGVEAAPGETEDAEDFIAPVPDQIQEVRLTTNTDASQGFNGGVNVDMVTKSGSNKVHGDVYYYLRNDALEARNFFLPIVNKDNQNEAGVTLGGPVYIPKLYDGRNKTFFFASSDVYRYVTTAQVIASGAVFTVPTLAERQGDFSALLGPQVGTDELSRPIYQGEIYDPTTTRQMPDGTFIRDPFMAGGQLNVIPGVQLSAVSQAFAMHYTPPNQAGVVNNWLGPPAESLVDKNQWSLKLDHTIGQKHHLTFSLERLFTAGIPSVPGRNTVESPGCNAGHININGPQGYTDPEIGSGGDEDCRGEYRYRFLYTWLVSSNVVFDFRSGVTRDPNRNVLADPIAAYNEACAAGLKGTLTCLTPAVSIQNISGFGPGFNSARVHSQRTPISASLQWTRAKHQLAFGADYITEPFFYGNSQGSQGSFSFSHLETSLPGQFSSSTGAGFASYDIGAVDSGSVFSGDSASWFTSEIALYAQDKWRVTNKLTLDFGLRWELTVPGREGDNEISTFDPSKANPGAGDRLGALAFYGSGVGRNGLTQLGTYYFKAFAPKFGLAYAFDPKTVFRANFGISYWPYVEKWDGSLGPPVSLDGFSATRISSSLNSGITPAFYWDNGFPLTFPTFPYINSTLDNNQNATFEDTHDNRPPLVENLGAEIQRQLPGQVALNVGYVGTLGHRLYASYNLNSLPLQYLSLGSLLNDSITSPQAVAAGIPLPYPGYTGTVARALTPYPQYLNINDLVAQLGTSSYNSLQISAQRHFGSLTFLAAFTAAKFLEMSDEPGYGDQYANLNAQSIYIRKTARALASAAGTGDIPKQLSLSWYWDLPVGRGKRFLGNTSRLGDELLGNWRISGIQYYQAGTPLRLTTNESISSLGTVWPVLNPGVPIKNVGGCGNIQPGASGKDVYLNPAAFSDPAPFALGNMANLPNVRGCGYYDEDLGLEKGFGVGEGRRVALGAMFTNLFNRHQLLGLTTNIDNSAFGTFTGAGNPRTIQLYMKFIF